MGALQGLAPDPGLPGGHGQQGAGPRGAPRLGARAPAAGRGGRRGASGHRAVLTCRQTVGGSRVRRILAALLTKARYLLPVHAAVSAVPGAHTGDPIHHDVRDVSMWWVVHGREADIRPKIGTGEPLEKFGRAPSVIWAVP
jgi:hypothetical protein